MATIPQGGCRHDALEAALIDEFLTEHGCKVQTVSMLPVARRVELLRDATAYATLKLAEIEARAHFVDELHQ